MFNFNWSTIESLSGRLLSGTTERSLFVVDQLNNGISLETVKPKMKLL